MEKTQVDIIVSAAKLMKFDDMIHVEVGNGFEFKTYNVHSNALVARSEFFRKALSGTWKEAEERVVRLPDDDYKTFELYMHLVYNNELACIHDPPDAEEIGTPERLSLARLYVYCEKVRDTRGKNAAIKALIFSIHKERFDGKWRVPESLCVDIIYQGTVKGCPARRMLLDVFTHSIDGFWMTEKTLYDYPSEFLQDLAVSTMMRRPRGPASGYTAAEDGGLAYLEEEDTNNKP